MIYLLIFILNRIYNCSVDGELDRRVPAAALERFACLGETPLPRVRCLLALFTYLLTCMQ